MSRLHALSDLAVFNSLWLDYDPLCPLLPQLLASLYSLEQQLSLEAGFLANDHIIRANLRNMAVSNHKELSVSQYRHHLLSVLEGVKILDPSSESIYGDFSDHFDLYKDNLDTMYRKTRSPSGFRFESIGSDMASLETFGAASPVHDLDVDLDVDSVADSDVDPVDLGVDSVDLGVDSVDSVSDPVDSVSERDPSRTSSQGAGELSSRKFELHEMLNRIQNCHQNISSAFVDIDDKLKTLKSQNCSDLQFLDKLTAQNALMYERTHDMRSEISDIYTELRSMRPSAPDRAGPVHVATPPRQVPLDSSFLERTQEMDHACTSLGPLQTMIEHPKDNAACEGSRDFARTSDLAGTSGLAGTSDRQNLDSASPNLDSASPNLDFASPNLDFASPNLDFAGQNEPSHRPQQMLNGSKDPSTVPKHTPLVALLFTNTLRTPFLIITMMSILAVCVQEYNKSS